MMMMIVGMMKQKRNKEHNDRKGLGSRTIDGEEEEEEEKTKQSM